MEFLQLLFGNNEVISWTGVSQKGPNIAVLLNEWPKKEKKKHMSLEAVEPAGCREGKNRKPSKS